EGGGCAAADDLNEEGARRRGGASGGDRRSGGGGEGGVVRGRAGGLCGLRRRRCWSWRSRQFGRRGRRRQLTGWRWRLNEFFALQAGGFCRLRRRSCGLRRCGN